MVITLIGAIVILLSILFLFVDARYLFGLLIIVSPFTATAAINFPNQNLSILLYHVVGGFFIIKILVQSVINKHSQRIKCDKFLLLFMVVCGISLLYPIAFSSGVLVASPNSIVKYIGLNQVTVLYPIAYSNLQNFTQFLYLLFGFLIYLFVYVYMMNSQTPVNWVLKQFKVALFIVLLLGVLQLFVPVNLYNSIFRTDLHINNQFINSKVRISSVTVEASMLSVFILPMFLVCLYDLFNNKKGKVANLVLLILSSAVILENNSSTFWVGLLACFVMGCIAFIRNIANARITATKLAIAIFALLFVGFVVMLNLDFILSHISMVVLKISGNDASGGLRVAALQWQMNVFRHFPVLGVGFGTVRSYDLFSTWLSEVGLVGFSMYLLFIANITVNLLKINDKKIIVLPYIIVSIVVMLLVSVPEPYYAFIWIFYSLASYEIQRINAKQSIRKIFSDPETFIQGEYVG